MAVSITRTANPAGVSSVSNVATYSNVAIGPAAPNRIVVLLVGTEQTSASINSATLGGNAMTALTAVNFGGLVYSRIFYLPYTTGTTATITVTFGTSPTNVMNHIAVYTVTDAVYSSEGTDSSSDMDSTDPLTTGSITIPSNAGFIAVAACRTDSAAKTWANATEDIDEDAGDFRFTTATRTTALTTTAVTCTGTTNGEDGALAYVIFADNTAPTTALNSPADAATGVSTTPVLDFTGTDTDGDSIRYDVQVDTVNTFNSQTIAVDATSNSGEIIATSSATWSHTVATGSNRNLVVGVCARGLKDSATLASTVTYNGDSLMKIREDTVDSGDTMRGRSSLWYIPSSDTGANNVVVTWNGTPEFGVGGAISLTGASSAIDASNGAASNTDTTPSVDVTVVGTGCLLIDVIYCRGAPPVTKDASQTSIHNVLTNTNGDGTGMSYKVSPGTGARTMTWTQGSAEEAIMSAVSIAPAPLLNVYSGQSTGFANPDTGGDTDPFNSGENIQYTVQSALSNSTTYYWRARGIDPAGSDSYGAWATTRSFTTAAAGSTAVKDIIMAGMIPFAR